MSNFAQISAEGVVTNVSVWGPITSPQDEQDAINFFTANVGPGPWIRTWYDAAQRAEPALYRYNFAGIGYEYRKDVLPIGAFVPPPPDSSWLLNTKTYRWQKSLDDRHTLL